MRKEQACLHACQLPVIARLSVIASEAKQSKIHTKGGFPFNRLARSPELAFLRSTGANIKT
jgi:hypothetical protein